MLDPGLEPQMPPGLEAPPHLSREVQLVPWFRARAQHGLVPDVHHPGGRHRDGARMARIPVRRDVPSDQRTPPVVRPSVHRIEQRVRFGIPRSKQPRPQRPHGTRPHRGEIRHGPRDRFPRDQIQLRPGLVVPTLDELIHREHEQIPIRGPDDGTIIPGTHDKLPAPERE